MDSAARVWLIGENNPYGDDPRYALYSEPPHSAGGRLRRLILGMTERDYLRSFERRNLLQAPRWSVPAARKAACRVMDEVGPQNVLLILFGRKVFDAFACTGAFRPANSGDGWRAFESEGRFLFLPHPSGLSRAWNEPGAFLRARQAVGAFAPQVAPLLGLEVTP